MPTNTCPPSCTSGFHVVETHDDIFLGRLVVDDVSSDIHVHNGFVGRPVVLSADEVVSIVAAERHPDVVEVQR